MCKVMEDMRKEAVEMANIEEIADSVGLSVEDVEDISNNLTA